MSNLTVSTAVDTFMQSTNQAAMQAALGGPGVLAKYMAFLASYGNDETGLVGDPTHPFATAYAASYALTQTPGWSSLPDAIVYLKILPGDLTYSFGEMAAPNASSVIYIEGYSSAMPVLGPIYGGAGYDLTVLGNGRQAVNVFASCVGPNTLTCRGVSGSFANAGTAGSSGGTGSDAGAIELDDCDVTLGISCNGGAGGDGVDTSSYATLTVNPGGWDGNSTVITFSGPSGSDTYEWNGDQSMTYQAGSGVSSCNGNTITASASGPGYSYSTDGESNADGNISFSDGSYGTPSNGGRGGAGGQVTIRRSRVTSNAEINICGGSGGTAADGGDNGPQGGAAPGVIAYACEIEVVNALNTTDPSQIQATERLCIEGGSAINSQN